MMTDAELAILSIVSEGPIYGYDIQTIIAERGLRVSPIVVVRIDEQRAGRAGRYVDLGRCALDGGRDDMPGRQDTIGSFRVEADVGLVGSQERVVLRRRLRDDQ